MGRRDCVCQACGEPAARVDRRLGLCAACNGAGAMTRDKAIMGENQAKIRRKMNARVNRRWRLAAAFAFGRGGR